MQRNRKLEVQINNRTYGLQCIAGEENRLRQVASYVDSRVQEITAQLGNSYVSESTILVMTCLLLADEYAEVKGQLQNIAASQQGGGVPMPAEIIDASKRLQRLADRLGTIADKVAA